MAGASDRRKKLKFQLDKGVRRVSSGWRDSERHLVHENIVEAIEIECGLCFVTGVQHVGTDGPRLLA